MDHDTAGCPAGSKSRPRRGLRFGLVLAGLLAAGLLAAACGGGSKDPAAAGAGRTTTTATPSAAASSGALGQTSQAQQQQQLLELAQCLRSHGVPSFKDPSPGAGILQTLEENPQVDPRSPAFQAALKACQRYTPEANLTPAQVAAQNAQGVAQSQCMRSHGVPNFPDPTTGPIGEQVIDMRGTGVDPSSPTVQAAEKACQKLFPGSK
jgi:hypothetical protein